MKIISITRIPGYKFIEKLLSVIDERWGECYLVGGAIRDYFLDRSSCDLDFVVQRREDFLARKFANSIGGKFFILGEGKERVSRVVLRTNDKVWKFDFTVFRGNDIFDDLEKRDFTINALAVSIINERFIDLFDGILDIKRRIINPITRTVFVDDPLRILRAFRLSYSLSFFISHSTYELIKKDKVLLRRVSGERIRDEFFELLKVPNFPDALLELYREEVIKILFPSLIYDYELCKRYKILIANEVGKRFPTFRNELSSYLLRNTSANRKKKEILKLALLFLFLSQEEYMNYLDFLRLTRQEVKGIGAIISQTRRFLKEGKPSLENLFSLPLYVQDELPGVALLLYLFDKISVSFEILDIYYKKLLYGRGLPRFIDGNILQERWGIPKGPLIKEVLDKVRIAQIEGKISTREDAERFVDNLVKDLTL